MLLVSSSFVGHLIPGHGDSASVCPAWRRLTRGVACACGCVGHRGLDKRGVVALEQAAEPAWDRFGRFLLDPHGDGGTCIGGRWAPLGIALRGVGSCPWPVGRMRPAVDAKGLKYP